MNLARIKLIAQLIIALCKVQSVYFEKLLLAFEPYAQSGSNLRRIQRFMADYMLDCNLIVWMIFKLLPYEPPYVLMKDRTNWKFGQTNINILVIAIAYDCLAFPLIYRLMPQRGNSSTSEIIGLIDRYIHLFGKEIIAELFADREFVEEEWIAYLNRKSIAYHLRIRNNFGVFDPRKQKRLKVHGSFILYNLEILNL